MPAFEHKNLDQADFLKTFENVQETCIEQKLVGPSAHLRQSLLFSFRQAFAWHACNGCTRLSAFAL